MYNKNDVFGTGPTKLANLAEKIMRENHVQNVLEVGCGQGRDAFFFSELGYNVVALDISKEAVDFVKGKKTELGLKNIHVFYHDIKRPLDYNKYFDFIYSNLALHFFNADELNLILKNISKTMKKDSFFMLSTKKKGDKYFNFGNKVSEDAFEYKGIIRYFFEEKVLRDLLSQQFNIIQFDSNNHINLDSSVSVWWSILVKKNKHV